MAFDVGVVYLLVRFSHSDGSIPKFTLPFFDAYAHVVDPYTTETRVPYPNITPDANHSPINDAAVIFRLHGTRSQNIPSWMFRQQQITTLNQPRIIHFCPWHFVFVKPQEERRTHNKNKVFVLRIERKKLQQSRIDDVAGGAAAGAGSGRDTHGLLGDADELPDTEGDGGEQDEEDDDDDGDDVVLLHDGGCDGVGVVGEFGVSRRVVYGLFVQRLMMVAGSRWESIDKVLAPRSEEGCSAAGVWRS